MNDLGRLAQPMLTVERRDQLAGALSQQNTTHPELATYATVLQRLGAARRERAQQLLYFCLVNKLVVAKPREFEQEFHRMRAGVRQGEDRMTRHRLAGAEYWLVAWDENLTSGLPTAAAPMSRGRSRTPLCHGARAVTKGPCAVRACCASGSTSGGAARSAACGISSRPAGSRTSRRRATRSPCPHEPCICRPDPAPSPAPVASLLAIDALYQALVLGLCTAWCYDPRRPVLWTRASLTRQLELFDGRGFYA